jgi:hypothetical protein
MFEAVISAVQTGKVQRMAFDTRDEAERYLELQRELLMSPTRWSEAKQEWVKQKPKSMRDYRMEIVRLDAPAVVAVARRAEKGQRRRKKAAA